MTSRWWDTMSRIEVVDSRDSAGDPRNHIKEKALISARRLALAAAAIVLGGALAACGDSSDGGSGASGGDMTIRLAVNTNATVLPAWVAQEQGFFKANGLDVTFTNVDNIST